MIQTMKTDNLFAIKLNTERILLTILILLSIILITFFVKQNSEIKQLKSDIEVQRTLNRNLESVVVDLENKNSDLESKIDDIESRVDDLENNSDY